MRVLATLVLAAVVAVVLGRAPTDARLFGPRARPSPTPSASPAPTAPPSVVITQTPYPTPTPFVPPLLTPLQWPAPTFVASPHARGTVTARSAAAPGR
jgi:hypothetical protein